MFSGNLGRIEGMPPSYNPVVPTPSYTGRTTPIPFTPVPMPRGATVPTSAMVAQPQGIEAIYGYGLPELNPPVSPPVYMADGGSVQRKMIDNPQPTNDLQGIVLQPGQSYTSIATPVQREAPSPFVMPSAARSADDVYRELRSNPLNSDLPDEMLRKASQNRANFIQSQYDQDMAFYNSPVS